MIELRGKRIQEQGEEVDRMISEINRRFPTKKTLAIWYIDADYTTMSDDGPEYGHLVSDRTNPTMFVATRGHTSEQVAGQIAFQYAKYLQLELGKEPPSQSISSHFARHMNGHPEFPYAPAALADFYTSK